MRAPAQYFRAGAGSVILNGAGLVLALERASIPGAWQLPQGGLRASEEPLDAAYRETAEETGISRADLELLDSFPEPLAYELPAGARSAKTGRGQAQYWFLFRFRGEENRIDPTASEEFCAWRWMPFHALIEATVDFRRPVYRRLAERFQGYLTRKGEGPG